MTHRWLVGVSLASHLAIALGLAVAGVWRLEQLTPDHRLGHLTSVPMLPPTIESGGATPKPPPPRPEPPAKRPARGPVQPSKRPVDQPPAPTTGSTVGPTIGPETSGTPGCEPGQACDAPPVLAKTPVCGDGELDPGEQCDDGNRDDGDGCSASCQREPPRPLAPRNVAAAALRALRLSGDTALRPDATTQDQLLRDGVRSVHGAVNLCVGIDGSVSQASLRTSTGYPAYDEVLVRGVRGWRYQPYQVGGQPVPVCSVVAFVYTIE